MDVFLLGVAILAVSLLGCGFRSHLPTAPAPRRPTPARTARRATAREPAPAPAQSLPGSVTGHAPPLHPSRVLGDPSWREWDGVAHGTTPREAATGLLCMFLHFADIFFNSEKKMSAEFNVLKAFSALKETSTRRGGRAGPRHLLTAFNQVPLSKQKQKPQQCKLSNDSMPALPLKHSARFCCALQQVERLHGTGFLHYPHHHPRSLIP